MLSRLYDIKRREDGFSRDVMKWAKFYFKKRHISTIDFTLLKDEELLKLFESIMRRYYTPY
ncbi:MAG TPA: hypothetical protein ENI23_08210 [bacterium]|nr:hypothetical protein [bacterium]